MDGQAMVEIEQAVLCIYNQALDRDTRQNANLFLDQAFSSFAMDSLCPLQ
jgi:hypothetical protein